MKATLSAKNKKPTQAGKDRWGILINGSWWNTTNEAVGEVIETLNKGDAVEVELAEKDGWKNVNAIELITDVNADMKTEKKYTKKEGDGDRTTSIVRQALLKASGSVTIPPFVWEMMLSDIMGEELTPADVVKVTAQRAAAFSKRYAQDLESFAKGE